MNGLENTPYYEATRVGLTGQPGMVRWSESRVIWPEQYGSRAAVMAVTDSYDSRFRYLYLLMNLISNEWFPAEQASPAQLIPYNEGNSKGVFLQLTQSIMDSTERVRIRFGSYEPDAPVSDGHICVAIWDVDSDSAGPLEFTQVKVANQWTPCVTRSVPLSDAQFGDAYLNANPETHEWACGVLLTADSSEERLDLVMSVIRRAHLPEHEEALGLLGAGAMEDMMSDWLLDRLKDYLPFSESLKYCLSMVRMEFEPDALQQRLNAMLAVR